MELEYTFCRIGGMGQNVEIERIGKNLSSGVGRFGQSFFENPGVLHGTGQTLCWTR